MIRQPLLRPPNKCFLPRHCRGKSDTLVDIIERSFFSSPCQVSLSFGFLEASRTSLLQSRSAALLTLFSSQGIVPVF